jgi:hypothetical protein
MLQARQQIPHFTIRDRDGSTVDYGRIWQHQNLLLVLLDSRRPDTAATYVEHLQAHPADLTAHDTACVVTGEAVPGAPLPGVIIADRWGEIWHVHRADSNADLPRAEALVEWLRYVQMQCPECQGETR